jgi:hypothetical protein
MKLRIRENTIRMRLTQGEVEALKRSGAVESKTTFGTGKEFKYGIRLSKDEKVSVEYNQGNIAVLLPQTRFEPWSQTDQVSIEDELYVPEKLSVLIEKDFKCLTRRDPKEDEDTFPNPHEKSC